MKDTYQPTNAAEQPRLTIAAERRALDVTTKNVHGTVHALAARANRALDRAEAAERTVGKIRGDLETVLAYVAELEAAGTTTPAPRIETSDWPLRRTPREEFAAMARDELDAQLRAAQHRDDPRVSVDVIHLGRLLAHYDVLEHHATSTAAQAQPEPKPAPRPSAGLVAIALLREGLNIAKSNGQRVVSVRAHDLEPALDRLAHLEAIAAEPAKRPATQEDLRELAAGLQTWLAAVTSAPSRVNAPERIADLWRHPKSK